MYLADYGEKFQYVDVEYTIGEAVIGTKEGEYYGVPGILMAIKDENNKLEFQCAFFEPSFSENRDSLYQRLPELKGTCKKHDGSYDGMISVEPEMVISLKELKRRREKRTVFCLTEDWAYRGNSGVNSSIFTDLEDAKQAFELLLCEEKEYYGISYFCGDPKFVKEITETSVKAFVEGNYIESHYELKIEEKELYMSESFINSVENLNISRMLYEELKLYFDEIDELTNEELCQVVENPVNSSSVNTELKDNIALLRVHRESAYSISQEVLNEAVKKKLEENK